MHKNFLHSKYGELIIFILGTLLFCSITYVTISLIPQTTLGLPVYNLTISLLGGAIFYFFFTWLPFWRRKHAIKPYKERLFARLYFQLGYVMQELFFHSFQSKKKLCRYDNFIKYSKIKKLFSKYKIDENNFDEFLKELFDPHSAKKFNAASNDIRKFLEENSTVITQTLSKEDFSEVIKNITTIHPLHHNENVGEFIVRSETKIIAMIDKIYRFSEFLSKEEIEVLSKISDLKFFRLFTGSEAIFGTLFPMKLDTFPNECYELYLTSFELRKILPTKNYQHLINT